VGAEVINRVTGLPYTANLPGRAKEMTDNDLLTELQIHMALMNAYGAISGELSAEAAREWVRIILAAQKQKMVDEGWTSQPDVVELIKGSIEDEHSRIVGLFDASDTKAKSEKYCPCDQCQLNRYGEVIEGLRK
jgi:hypothetical protein